jgi:hypothetical protein
MPFDAHKNFAYSTVALAPSPATSGTILCVATGEGALFPTLPVDASIWPAGTQPTAVNAEVVRLTTQAPPVRESYEASSGAFAFQNNASLQRVAQSYIAPVSGTLTAMSLVLQRQLSPVDNLTVEIRSDTAGSPGSLLSTVSIVASGIPTSETWTSTTQSLAQVAGTTYWIEVYRSGSTDATNYVNLSYNAAAGYANGVAKTSADGGGSWSLQTADVLFRADITASNDTFLITRTQESSSARTIIVGDQIAATVTSKVATDLESLFSPDISLSDMTTTADETIPASYSAIVASDYEMGDSESYTGNSNQFGFSGNLARLAQQFKHGGRVSMITLALTQNTAVGSVALELWSDRSGSPGTLLATSANVNVNTITGSETSVPFLFTPTVISPETLCWMVLRGASLTNGVFWYGDSVGTYTYGTKTSADSGSTWTDGGTVDYKFNITYSPFTEIAVGAVLEIS